MKVKPGVRIQSVERILDIIECLSQASDGLKLTNISNQLDINISTCYNLIDTLKFRGYVYQEKDTKKYRLGIKIMSLQNAFLKGIDLQRLSHPILENLQYITSETVHLAILEDYHLQTVVKIESKHAIKVSVYNDKGPLYCTATGKALLCGMTESDLLEYLNQTQIEKYTPNTETDRQKIFKDIIASKERGYTLDNMEYQDSVYCVGAPIYNSKGQVEASVSISTPSIRWNEQRIEQLINRVQEATRKISTLLGYNEVRD